MVRAESANDDPRFLDMMADMVLRTIRRLRAGRALPLAPARRAPKPPGAARGRTA